MSRSIKYLDRFLLGLVLAATTAACSGGGSGRSQRDGAVDGDTGPDLGQDRSLDLAPDVELVDASADSSDLGRTVDGGGDAGSDETSDASEGNDGGTDGGVDRPGPSLGDAVDSADVVSEMDDGGPDEVGVDSPGDANGEPVERDAGFTCPSSDDGGAVLTSAPDNVVFYPNVTVSTFAGGPSDSNLSNPVGIAILPDGDLVVSDYDSSALRRVSSTGAVSVLTSQLSFRYPFALTYDRVRGVVYATTDANAQGSKNSSPRTSATVWSVNPGSGLASNLPVATGIGYMRGVGVLSDGRVVAADRTNRLIWLIDPAAGTKRALAGNAACTGGADGQGASATFTDPYGLAVLPDDSIVVADYGLRVLRKITTAGVVTTFAGDGGPAGTIDGPARSARFVRPQAVAADAQGVVYVSDTGTNRIRRVGLGGMVTTLAGNGTQAYADGNNDVAAFYGGEGIAASADGTTVYVADGTFGSDTPVPYHRIRKLTIRP
jgi:hypothetical protein